MTVDTASTSLNTASNVDRDLAALRKTSGQIVGSVFYGTLLKTMRQSVIKGEYGHGGRGEEVFANQLDAILAERMGTAGNSGLANVLYDRLERQQIGMSRASALAQEGSA